MDASEKPEAARGCVLALDIGGTNLKGGIFTTSGIILAQARARTFSEGSDAHHAVIAILEGLHRQATGMGLHVLAIGVCTPGLVDRQSGTVRYAANLGWAMKPLKRDLADRFTVPVSVDHDATAAANAMLHSRNSEEDFVLIPIGTGISAAMVINGRVVSGAKGEAGEFGHVNVIPNGEPCVCGQRGCLEVYASGGGIYRRYAALGGTMARSTAEISCLLREDGVAARVWDEAVEALAVGIAALVAILDPSEVIIGGGLSQAGDLLTSPLNVAVQDRLGWRATPTVTVSALGSAAALKGSALAALRMMPYELRQERCVTLTPPAAP